MASGLVQTNYGVQTAGTTSINVTSVASNPTIQLKVLHGNNTAGETLGTVGASKTWYIIGVTMNVAQTAGAGGANSMSLVANGVTIFGVTAVHIATYGNDTNSLSIIAPAGYYIGAPLTAGQTIATSVGGTIDDTQTTVLYIEV